MSEVNERTTTENYGLILPQYDEIADIADINENMETIDREMNNISTNMGTIDTALNGLRNDLYNLFIVQSTSVYLHNNMLLVKHCSIDELAIAITGYQPIAIVGWRTRGTSDASNYVDFISFSRLNLSGRTIYIDARLNYPDNIPTQYGGSFFVEVSILYKRLLSN